MSGMRIFAEGSCTVTYWYCRHTFTIECCMPTICGQCIAVDELSTGTGQGTYAWAMQGIN